MIADDKREYMLEDCDFPAWYDEYVFSMLSVQEILP